MQLFICEGLFANLLVNCAYALRLRRALHLTGLGVALVAGGCGGTPARSTPVGGSPPSTSQEVSLPPTELRAVHSQASTNIPHQGEVGVDVGVRDFRGSGGELMQRVDREAAYAGVVGSVLVHVGDAAPCSLTLGAGGEVVVHSTDCPEFAREAVRWRLDATREGPVRLVLEDREGGELWRAVGPRDGAWFGPGDGVSSAVLRPDR